MTLSPMERAARASKRGGAGEKGEDGKFPFQEQIKNAPFPGALRRAGEPCQHVVLPHLAQDI